jgi:RNA polymerase sigma-70 factor (family 1)
VFIQDEVQLKQEKELLASMTKGNKLAFEKIYLIYSTRLIKKLLRLVKDEEIAKEILQDVFLKIWERRKTIDPARSFPSLLFRITENLVIDFFRKAATDKKVMDYLISISTELYSGADEALEKRDEFMALEEAIMKLPEQRRRIFRLCKLEGKSYEEVATLLGITSGTVNDHMVKAMRALRKHFTSDGTKLAILVSFLFGMRH